MRHNRIIKLWANGLARYSDDKGITWKCIQLTQFTGPKELKLI